MTDDRTHHEVELSLRESVWIGPNIQVKLINVRPYYANIGIEAPKDVVIVRDEIYFGPERK